MHEHVNDAGLFHGRRIAAGRAASRTEFLYGFVFENEQSLGARILLDHHGAGRALIGFVEGTGNSGGGQAHGNSRAKAQFNQAFHRTISLDGLHGFALSTCGKHSVFCALRRAIAKTPPITAARSTGLLYQPFLCSEKGNCSGVFPPQLLKT